MDEASQTLLGVINIKPPFHAFQLFEKVKVISTFCDYVLLKITIWKYTILKAKRDHIHAS
jgi:hypothetical protein